MIIRICNEICSKLPDFNILAYTMDVKVEDSSKINDTIIKTEKQILEEYSIEDVISIPLIKEARDAYKKLGKDPSRYRLACESLLRRIVKGNELFRINNLVDSGNILSIEAKRSTAVLDYDKIVGDVFVRLGKKSDVYEGIGRGIIDVSNIPLYTDDIGPFGSPTSDTLRTMITNNTKKILLLIICFSEKNIEKDITRAKEIFSEFGYAQNIQKIEVFRM